MPTFVKSRIAAGAETVTDQLAGTAVAFAGPTGRVRAGAMSVLSTTTLTLKGRNSGIEIVPKGSFAVAQAITAIGDKIGDVMIYEGFVKPGEPLELEIIAAAATTTFVAVRTD
jgi:hypothetical protein